MQVLDVEPADSDFAELTLFDKNGAPADTMFLGEPYFDEVPEPSPLKWQTILGIDRAKAEKIHQDDYTFAGSQFGFVSSAIHIKIGSLK